MPIAPIAGLPYLGFERQQQLPKPQERFLLQLPGKVATLLDILDGTPPAEREAVVAAAQMRRRAPAFSTGSRTNSAISTSCLPMPE